MLIFPLHLPSAILCSLFFVSVISFYGLTTYVSIANNYAPFSSPASCLLTHGFAMLQIRHIPILQIAQHIASAISFHNHPQGSAGTSDETMQSSASNGAASPPALAQPNDPNSITKSNMVPHSHPGIDPHTHVHKRLDLTPPVKEGGTATTPRENIPRHNNHA